MPASRESPTPQSRFLSFALSLGTSKVILGTTFTGRLVEEVVTSGGKSSCGEAVAAGLICQVRLPKKRSAIAPPRPPLAEHEFAPSGIARDEAEKPIRHQAAQAGSHPIE